MIKMLKIQKNVKTLLQLVIYGYIIGARNGKIWKGDNYEKEEIV